MSLVSSLYALPCVVVAFLVSSVASVRAGVVDTLNPGDIDAVFNTIGDLPTWDGNGDTDDATFTLRVDFDAKPGGFDEVLWETGATGTGSSLLYVASNTLRFSTIQSGTQVSVDYQLNAAQIAAGEIFVSWVFDLGSDEIRINTSHVNGFNNHETVASMAYSGTDWSDGDGAGFGSSTTPVGGYGAAFPGTPFSSGTINTTEGLLMYAGDAYAPSPVPEPAGAIALASALGLVCFQRRRS